MTNNTSSRVLEQQALAALNQRVVIILASIIPLITGMFALQYRLMPVWQFEALVFEGIVEELVLLLALVLARRGAQERSVAITMFSALIYCIVAMALRKDTLPEVILGDMVVVAYGFVFVPKLLLPGATLAIVSTCVAQIAAFLGLLPQASGTPLMGLFLDVTVSAAAIPTVVFFFGRRLSLNELPFRELEQTANEQKTLLCAVARVRKQIDEMIVRLEAASVELSSQARQQSVTSEQVASLVDEFQAMLSEAVCAAHDTKAAAGEAQQESAEGWSKLEAVGAGLNRFLTVFEAMRASIRVLSEHSERTEGIVRGIGEVDKELNVLAVNAAIEAARAGESGRGFAVVANELQAMIRKTTAQTRDSRELLGKIRTEAAQSLKSTDASADQLRGHVDALDYASALIRKITESFLGTTKKVTSLAVVADRQQGLVQQVAQAMQDLKASAGQLKQSAEDLSESMQRMGQGQRELGTLTSKFQALEADGLSAMDG